MTDTCLLLFQNIFLILFCRQLIKKKRGYSSHRVTYNLRRLLPLQWKKKLSSSPHSMNQDESAVKTQRAVNSQTARMRRMHVQLSQVYSHIRVSNSLDPDQVRRFGTKLFAKAITAVKEMRTSHGAHIVKDDQRRVGVTIHLFIPKY